MESEIQKINHLLASMNSEQVNAVLNFCASVQKGNAVAVSGTPTAAPSNKFGVSEEDYSIIAEAFKDFYEAKQYAQSLRSSRILTVDEGRRQDRYEAKAEEEVDRTGNILRALDKRFGRETVLSITRELNAMYQAAEQQKPDK